jgi:hypothetical protein
VARAKAARILVGLPPIIREFGCDGPRCKTCAGAGDNRLGGAERIACGISHTLESLRYRAQHLFEQRQPERIAFDLVPLLNRFGLHDVL